MLNLGTSSVDAQSPLLPLMNFRVTCELDYTLQAPATFLFSFLAIASVGQEIRRENLTIEPQISTEEFKFSGGLNRVIRIKTHHSGFLSVCYAAEIQVYPLTQALQSIKTSDPGSLDPEILPFLFPSRYCQSDCLRQMAQQLFGHLPTPYAIAAAVSSWIFENVAYVSGSSDENSSAIDTLGQRQGVCRDFAHLGIGFCRALNIPARYTACYAYQLIPQDFHACFEVFIGDRWYLFDATRLVPMNGIIRISTGRDAADAAVCSIFGNPEISRSIVTCESQDSHFVAITQQHLVERNEAIYLR